MNKKKILISGGNGKLAKLIVKNNSNKYDIYAPSHEKMDITKYDSIEDYILMKGNYFSPINYFVHAASITRPMSQHEDNPILSIDTNIIGTCNVVKACIKYNIKLIYISSDAIYNGHRRQQHLMNGFNEFKETDDINPVNKYAWSKLGGESAVRLYDNSLILRVAMQNLPWSHPAAYDSVYKNCISDEDFSKIILQFVDETGIINVGSETISSLFEFAKRHDKNVKKKEWDKNPLIGKDLTMNICKMQGILNANKS